VYGENFELHYYSIAEVPTSDLSIAFYLLQKRDFKTLAILFYKVKFLYSSERKEFSSSLRSSSDFSYIVRLFSASRELIARQNEKPIPGLIQDGIFYPQAFEEMDCCKTIRYQNTSFPNCMLFHCRSGKHVANLYGVDKKDLNSLCLQIRKKEDYDAKVKEWILCTLHTGR